MQLIVIIICKNLEVRGDDVRKRKEKKYDIERNLDVHKCNVTYFTTVF